MPTLTTDLFQITSLQVITELNGLNELGLPSIGGPDGLTDDMVISYAKRAESRVASSIPEMYRAMLREVRGEIVVEAAYTGQTTFNCGLYPVVEDSLDIYVDFGYQSPTRGSNESSIGSINQIPNYYSDSSFGISGKTPYGFRTQFDKLPAAAFTLDAATGAVTLTAALGTSQKVYADYKHTGMSRCDSLRDIVIKIAAASVGKTLSGVTADIYDVLDRMEANAQNQLVAIMNGTAGIDLLDNLNLVDETRTPNKTPRGGFQVWM